MLGRFFMLLFLSISILLGGDVTNYEDLNLLTGAVSNFKMLAYAVTLILVLLELFWSRRKMNIMYSMGKDIRAFYLKLLVILPIVNIIAVFLLFFILQISGIMGIDRITYEMEQNRGLMKFAKESMSIIRIFPFYVNLLIDTLIVSMVYPVLINVLKTIERK
jgi:hypothetical protein